METNSTVLDTNLSYETLVRGKLHVRFANVGRPSGLLTYFLLICNNVKRYRTQQGISGSYNRIGSQIQKTY
jgi:hypothetical protein